MKPIIWVLCDKNGKPMRMANSLRCLSYTDPDSWPVDPGGKGQIDDCARILPALAPFRWVPCGSVESASKGAK